ncbi:hypothetical protein [Microbacterium sp. USTB-Y]|uniref:DUF6932 family protein n=1 Tax=Microbacterium sp. USTB-Y TaxID=2823692 RepID=UPI00203CD542|nr:hypothetical protein [Microbacterium sp. USTB-Y]
MLPRLTKTGHLPPGRHPATLPAIHEQFVEAFPTSTTRAEIWDGFIEYLRSWDEAEQSAGVEVLRGIWIAGGFTTDAEDPSDIDVSPIYDKGMLDGLNGKPGSGRLKRLFSHRESIARDYRVEPFALPWAPIASTLFATNLPPAERDMLAVRGGLDSWWGRTRPPGERVAPQPPTTLAERGYLEVILR